MTQKGEIEREVIFGHDWGELLKGAAWAMLADSLVIAGLIFVIQRYFDEEGVRVLLLALGSATLLTFYMFLHSWWSRDKRKDQEVTVNALIAHQAWDDRGEIGRMRAGGLEGLLPHLLRYGAVQDKLLQKQVQMLEEARREGAKEAGPKIPDFSKLLPVDDEGDDDEW